MDIEKEKTFKMLFEKHYQQLYQHALSFMKDEETAKDIVNDVFLFFGENFDRFSNSTLYLSLLYTLVRNHCIDHLRHYDVEDKYIQYLKFAFTEEDIDYYTQYQELLDEAFKRLNALPKQAREVVYACLVEGKNYKEVAEQMGISPNTVKNHIVQSLSKMRKETENSKKKSFYIVFFYPFLVL
ncbi:RNA polymerase sigma-70 factor [Bacteroides xylanisolvens]|uniref:RNA polymerase sigma-70 factor n=1 Tax=Bacteroides xylanisolvens TaxID=371601 RepID=UPI001898ACB8|nr:RNA polymerase sigma-70 factor [Bacteroides xylanisolvens]